MTIVMSSTDSEFPFDASMFGVSGDNAEWLMPLLLMVGSVAGTLLAMTSIYYVWKNNLTNFVYTACYISVMALSILYFELFGVYIILGLQYNPKYFQYLTIAGISCFLTSISTNKMSVIFFLLQYNNHPLIDNTTWRSPRTKYYVTSIVLQLLFYLGAFFMCRYPAFCYYILPFYYFPLFHIGNSVLKKTKNTFKWYYQLLIWIPIVIHAIFIRGYDNNFIQLTPWNKMQYVVPISMAVMVGSCVM
jgi:hypothetical protein